MNKQHVKCAYCDDTGYVDKNGNPLVQPAWGFPCPQCSPYSRLYPPLDVGGQVVPKAQFEANQKTLADTQILERLIDALLDAELLLHDATREPLRIANTKLRELQAAQPARAAATPESDGDK